MPEADNPAISLLCCYVKQNLEYSFRDRQTTLCINHASSPRDLPVAEAQCPGGS